MNIRKRDLYTIWATLAVVILYFLSDPDVGILQSLPIGGSTLATILIILKGTLYATAVHYTRKSIFDYESADLEKLFDKAKESPVGAGLAVIGIALIYLTMGIIFIGAGRV